MHTGDRSYACCDRRIGATHAYEHCRERYRLGRRSNIVFVMGIHTGDRSYVRCDRRIAQYLRRLNRATHAELLGKLQRTISPRAKK